MIHINEGSCQLVIIRVSQSGGFQAFIREQLPNIHISFLKYLDDRFLTLIVNSKNWFSISESFCNGQCKK